MNVDTDRTKKIEFRKLVKQIMAKGEEIIEHMKKAVVALLNKENSWKKKIKEFLFEILIIIVAVSLTLWFHNLNDRSHERQQEKEFLIGIKNDLKKDTSFIQNQIDYFKLTLNYYDTLWQQLYQHRIDSAYIDKHSGSLVNTVYSAFDNSRFESFRSSGNLKLIENQKLLLEITNLFSTALPFREKMDQFIFDTRREDFATYIGRKALIDSSGLMHVSRLLNDPAVRYQIFSDREILEERRGQQKELIKGIGKVIADIDVEVKKRF